MRETKAGEHSPEPQADEDLGKKIFGHYLDKAIFGAVELGVVLLVLPLSWRSTPFILGIAALGWLLFIRTGKAKRLTIGRRILRLVVLPTVVLGFAVAWPLFVFPKPLYIFPSDTANWFRAKVAFLPSGNATVASIMQVSDPIRNALIPFLKKLPGAHIRIVETTENNGVTFCNLPLLDNFLVDSKSVGDVTWTRSLYFPLTTLGREVRLKLVKEPVFDLQGPNGSTVEFAMFVSGTFRLINFAYTQYPDTIPWNAVRVTQNPDIASLKYIAYVDFALECTAVGKTGKAMQALESASGILPTSNLEATRLATLQYLLGNRLLNGNIGSLQSLPTLHSAFDLFFLASQDPRFSARDPLTRWLRDTLISAYHEWYPMFMDRGAKLKAVQAMDLDLKSEFDLMTDEMRDVSDSDLIDYVKTRSGSRAKLFYLRAKILERIGDRIAFMNRIVTEKEGFKALALRVSEASEKALPAVRYIETRLAETGDLVIEPFSTRSPVALGDFAERAYKWNENSDPLDLVTGLYGPIDDWQKLFSTIDGKFSKPDAMRCSRGEWWTSGYYIWFAWWAMDAITEIDRVQYPWKKDYLPHNANMAELIKTAGLDAFKKDTGGSGRTFVPGLFLLLWYAKTHDLEGCERLNQEFETKTLVSYEQYLSLLRPL